MHKVVVCNDYVGSSQSKACPKYGLPTKLPNTLTFQTYCGLGFRYWHTYVAALVEPRYVLIHLPLDCVSSHVGCKVQSRCQGGHTIVTII